MNLTPEIDSESFDLEDSGDIIGLAKHLVNGRHPGILATVDLNGRPAVRWMSTFAFDEFPVFHTLTAPDSRKVKEIELRPEVNWMFFNQDRSMILNLIGTAHVIKDATTLKVIWQKVKDKSLTYFLDKYAKPPGFVAIETKIESIECTSPKSALRFAIEPVELKDVRY